MIALPADMQVLLAAATTDKQTVVELRMDC
jgi:hypothetical protein